jgi:ADP-heptose:LPS heptosyltransferase
MMASTLRKAVTKLKLQGLLFFARLVIRKPRNGWDALKAFPLLFLYGLLLRRPVILVSRYGAIGDIICTLPSLAALKQRRSNLFIVYETQRHYMAIPRHCRFVDLTIEHDSLLAIFLRRVLKAESMISPKLPDEYTPPHPGRKIHLVDEFGNSFGVSNTDKHPVRLEVESQACKQVKRRLQRGRMDKNRVVVIHIGPTWKVREWPQRNWLLLASRLQTHCNVRVIQVGEKLTSSGDLKESEVVDCAENWLGSLTLDQTMALLSLADLFVGIDSGVLHMAGSVGTPCIGIFGPTDPACRLSRTGLSIGITAGVSCLGCHHDPKGPRHWRSGCENNIKCMAELSVDAVFNASVEMLALPKA